MSKPKKFFLIILAFFAVYVIWGSTYLLNKIAVAEIAPLKLAAIRFITASILIFSIAKVLRISLVITRKQLINSTIAGFLFLTYGNGVFVWALKYIDSGFAALEASLQPMVVLFFMYFIQKKQISIRSITGVILGIVGMYVLVAQNGLNLTQDSIIGIIMIFTCVVSWSYASVFTATASLPSNFFVSANLNPVICYIIGKKFIYITQTVKINNCVCFIGKTSYAYLFNFG